MTCQIQWANGLNKKRKDTDKEIKRIKNIQTHKISFVEISTMDLFVVLVLAKTNTKTFFFTKQTFEKKRWQFKKKML